MMRAGIALGSNIEDRVEHLLFAREQLHQRLEAESMIWASLYETEPVDCPPGSPGFLNTVVEIQCDRILPESLLCFLLEIEKDGGRQRSVPNAPRTLDLDLLYIDNVEMDEPDLILPHPRLHQRRFVLEPLVEIRPNLILPGKEKPIADLMNDLPEDEGVKRIVEARW